MYFYYLNYFFFFFFSKRRRRSEFQGYWSSDVCSSDLGQEVALVGAGNSAGQAIVYLAGQVAKVWVLVRGPNLQASMSRYLVDRIGALPNVEVLTEIGRASCRERG